MQSEYAASKAYNDNMRHATAGRIAGCLLFVPVTGFNNVGAAIRSLLVAAAAAYGSEVPFGVGHFKPDNARCVIH